MRQGRKTQELLLVALLSLCAGLAAGSAVSPASLGPTLYSGRTLFWTMLLSGLVASLLMPRLLRRWEGTGPLGGVVSGGGFGLIAGAGVGLFAALHLIGENRDLLEGIAPVSLAWGAILGSCLTGVLAGAGIGLLLGAFGLAIARAILDASLAASESPTRKENR